MDLGAFSVSLAVKEIGASKEFYEKLGFSVFGGEMKEKWLIMKNADTVIGLFQGMFPENILTFNPGWNSDADRLPEFTDIRQIRRQLKAQGVSVDNEAGESDTGPASFTVVDPDGNAILLISMSDFREQWRANPLQAAAQAAFRIQRSWRCL